MQKVRTAMMNAIHDLPLLVAPCARDRFNNNGRWTLGRGPGPPGATCENTVDNRAWQ